MRRTIVALLIVTLVLSLVGHFAFGHYRKKKAEVAGEQPQQEQPEEEVTYEDLQETEEASVEGGEAAETDGETSDSDSTDKKKSKKKKKKKVEATRMTRSSTEIIAKLGESKSYAIPEDKVEFYTSKQFNAQVEDLAEFLRKYPNHRVDLQFYTKCIKKRRKLAGFSDAVSYPLPKGNDLDTLNEIVHRIRTIPGYCDMVSAGLARAYTENGGRLGSQLPALKSYHKAHNWGVKNGRKWQKFHARMTVMNPDDEMYGRLKEKSDKLVYLRGIEPWVEYEDDDEHIQTNIDFDEWCAIVISILLDFDYTGVEVVDSSFNYHLPPSCVGSDMTTKTVLNKEYEEVQKETFVFIAKNKNGGVGMRFGFNMQDGRFMQVLEHHKYVAVHNPTPARTTTSTKTTTPYTPPTGSRSTGSTNQDITADDTTTPSNNDQGTVIIKKTQQSSNTTIISTDNSSDDDTTNNNNNNNNEENNTVIIVTPGPEPELEEPKNKTEKDQSQSSAFQGNAQDLSGTQLPTDGDGEKEDKPEKVDNTVFEGSEDSGSRTIVVGGDSDNGDNGDNGSHASNGSTDSGDYSNREENGSTDSSGAVVDNQINETNDYVDPVDREEATPQGEAQAGFTMEDIPDE